jgi:hypothetical protein
LAFAITRRTGPRHGMRTNPCRGRLCLRIADTSQRSAQRGGQPCSETSSVFIIRPITQRYGGLVIITITLVRNSLGSPSVYLLEEPQNYDAVCPLRRGSRFRATRPATTPRRPPPPVFLSPRVGRGSVGFRSRMIVWHLSGRSRTCGTSAPQHMAR